MDQERVVSGMKSRQANRRSNVSQPVTEEAFKSLEFERHIVARERNPGFEFRWVSVDGLVIIALKPVTRGSSF